MASSETPETIPLRPCGYCRKRFRPAKLSGKNARFCSEDHRVEFHKFGTLEYRRLLDLMVSELKRQAQEAAMAKISPQDRKYISQSRKDAGKSNPGVSE